MSDGFALTRGERTRHSILNAAEHLILSQGYHGTSMRQIATGAGIAVGGIYNHFDSKEALFAALLARRQPYSDIAAGLSRLRMTSVTELITNAFSLVVSEGLADPAFIRLALVDLQEFNGDTVFRFATQFIHGLFTLFETLEESGEIRDDIPLPVLVRAFAGLVVFHVLSKSIAFGNGVPRVDLPFADRIDETDWIGGMVDLFLKGSLRELDP